jgi:hypothetical protein
MRSSAAASRLGPSPRCTESEFRPARCVQRQRQALIRSAADRFRTGKTQLAHTLAVTSQVRPTVGSCQIIVLPGR